MVKTKNLRWISHPISKHLAKKFSTYISHATKYGIKLYGITKILLFLTRNTSPRFWANFFSPRINR